MTARASRTKAQRSRGEQEVFIAAKLYETRSALRSLYGDEYPAKVGRVTADLIQLSARSKQPILVCSKESIEFALEAGQDVAAAWIMAATVEALERGE